RPTLAVPAAPTPTTGVYVYGVFAPHRADALRDLPAHGVDPAYPVYLLCGNGLCALVSQVGLDQFGEDVIEANLHDPAWLEAQVRQHQAVLSALLPQGTVVPFTFGTIFHSAERVQEMLHTQAQHWHTRLAYLHGREEWGVKLFCDPDVLRTAVLRSQPQAQRLQERITQASSGTAYMLKQQLETLTKNAVEEQIQMIADTIHATLLHDAIAGVRNNLPAPELNQTHEQVILNAAYLLLPDQLDAFRHELEQQIRAYTTYGITADLSGAWVPYNFANVDLPDHAATPMPLNPAELQEQP
ncbi:MAG: GvpL/GvpF family gas vesicle protein, partial [Chloroflexaceae bacterium]|nr:GvpL/GvpF family gas vesicle protein [Chloroflexaceae bacterium]